MFNAIHQIKLISCLFKLYPVFFQQKTLIFLKIYMDVDISNMHVSYVLNQDQNVI